MMPRSAEPHGRCHQPVPGGRMYVQCAAPSRVRWKSPPFVLA